MTEIRSQETARSAVSVRLLPPCANTLMMRIKRRKELRHRDPQNTEHVRYGGADLPTRPKPALYVGQRLGQNRNSDSN